MSDTHQIHHNYDLSKHNTMALSCIADTAIILHDEAALPTLDLTSFFVLSGGSNVLLPSRLHTTVLLPRMMGIKTVSEDDKQIILSVKAGEDWHKLVTHCVHQGWYGLENLALIPGLAGAAPVQNIGAYGVQLEDVLVSVRAFDWQTRSFVTLSRDDCHFAYRHSIFKDNPERYLIVAIDICLHKDPTRYNSSYGDLHAYAQKLADEQARPITPADVYQAVIAIRQSKLPDPKVLANCGSFFQNPIIATAQYNTLKEQYPTLPNYLVDDEHVKVPAGWLIDQAGLKGLGVAPILTHQKQALVLTNHAPQVATQADIKTAQTFIIDTVFDKFGIRLVREPVWVRENGQIGENQS
ncbi:UDP-N-acetylmuramate dehydrogenase [Moraxella nasicaprae]|uniref:UDP-N-acetylenolpyruvoylglucosamine reductase n=1 Tax=Moraxella nasicaprae TaxID=2904122 RepID=A0ABY6F5F7_9GAMM|nr:UDP-N-acetylmuramate dehydrogenase [Moraxella nasicaprae]UXZ05317.1 UDP-N-acetylmuramate dehydrogenase [Moraxella nasicaprae]